MAPMPPAVPKTEATADGTHSRGLVSIHRPNDISTTTSTSSYYPGISTAGTSSPYSTVPSPITGGGPAFHPAPGPFPRAPAGVTITSTTAATQRHGLPSSAASPGFGTGGGPALPRTHVAAPGNEVELAASPVDSQRSFSPYTHGNHGGGYGQDQRTPLPLSASTANDGSRLESPAPTASSEPNSKKRKNGPGSRGVANMTPEQLAKKRANDREAQRAIRERHKSKVEDLEREVRDLKSRQPYQEMQAAFRQKAAVEAELAEAKRLLANIIGTAKAFLSSSPGSEERHQLPPTQSQPQPPPLFSAAGSTPSSAASPGDTWAGNNSSRWQSEPPPPQFPGGAPGLSSLVSPPLGGGGGRPSQDQHHSLQSPVTTQDVGQLYSQQRHNLMHGLELGSERFELAYLVDEQQRQRIPRILSGLEGPQDTPHYRHVPMKHDSDWVATLDEAATDRSASAAAAGQHPSLESSNMAITTPFPAHTRFASAPMPQSTPFQTMGTGNIFPNSMHPPGSEPWSVLPKNVQPTCALDRILVDFANERRQRIADGLSVQEVIGPRYPSVSSLLNPAQSRFAHPLSKVFIDIIQRFPLFSGLPEKVAVLYSMFLLMRWQIDPTPENYDRVPVWLRPLPCQCQIAHPAWMEYMPFPRMRERVVEMYPVAATSTTTTGSPATSEAGAGAKGEGDGSGNGNVTNNDKGQQQPQSQAQNPQEPQPPPITIEVFFIPFTSTMSVNWPYGEEDCLLISPGTGANNNNNNSNNHPPTYSPPSNGSGSDASAAAADGRRGSFEAAAPTNAGSIMSDQLLINPVFEKHIKKLENWSLGTKFAEAFPWLDGTYYLRP